MANEDAPDSLQVRWWPLPPGRWGISVTTQGGEDVTERLDLSAFTGVDEPTARTNFREADSDRIVREGMNDQQILLESQSGPEAYIYEKHDGRYLMTDIRNKSTRSVIDRVRS